METLNPHLDHQHMIGTAFVKNPPLSVELAESWLKELVEKIGMKVLMGPFVTNCQTEGNEGITGIIVLETSHASFHAWHKVEKPFLKFDIYSCKSFSPEQIFDHLSVFSPEKIEYIMLDRNGDNEETARSVVTF